MRKSLFLIGIVVAAYVAAALAQTSNPAVAANTAFAVDLYHGLAGDPATDNIFYSPWSVVSVMGILTEGAQHNTLTQMMKALHFGESSLISIHEGISSLSPSFNTTNGYQLSSANAVWLDQQFPIEAAYLTTIRKYYGTNGAVPVDFLHNAEAARVKINSWAEEQTHGKIQDLIMPGKVDAMTRLVLTNAVYFKGTWYNQFSKNTTRPQPFHVTASKDVTAPHMSTLASFGYAEDDRVQILSMPYIGSSRLSRDISMVAILPKKADGLADIERSMTAQQLDSWAAAALRQPQNVRVLFPKFKVTMQAELNSILQNMGMTDAFKDQVADFSRISTQALKDQLHISFVVHKTFVNVDEDGTEAAAATAAGLAGGGPPPQNPPEFRADHPFIYLIRHNPSGTILFMGRLTNPGA